VITSKLTTSSKIKNSTNVKNVLLKVKACLIKKNKKKSNIMKLRRQMFVNPSRGHHNHKYVIHREATKYKMDTYFLTPWCRVLLEKLTGLQLVKKFPAFHGTRRFITALTSVRHLSLFWASPVHIPTSHLLEIHPNIIHPSTPRSP